MIYFGGDKRIVQARLPSEKGNSLIVNYGNKYKEPEGCSSTTTTHEDGLGNFERRCDGWVFVYFYVCHYLPLFLFKLFKFSQA